MPNEKRLILGDERYYPKSKFIRVLQDAGIDDDTDSDRKEEIYEEARGMLELKLAQRFIIPLIARGGGEFSKASTASRLVVQSAFKSAIRKVLGKDQNKNLTIDSTQKYIDVHAISFKSSISDLLNPKIPVDFELAGFAEDKDPVHTIGIARADNELDASTRIESLEIF